MGRRGSRSRRCGTGRARGRERARAQGRAGRATGRYAGLGEGFEEPRRMPEFGVHGGYDIQDGRP
ncbi:hypothetical protein, partial [Streptomyces eurythermus]|uniref:hypothetical protein n=1 Tax=Streptomyces eurythermus TaxID=42237 RepID=UPI0033F707BE